MPSTSTEDDSPPIACVLLSDTHSHHLDVAELPAGDLLIHAGDLTEHGTIKEIEDFFAWFASLPYTYKVCVAGNHDHSLEPGHIYKSALPQMDPNLAGAVGSVAHSVEESQRLTERIDFLRDKGTIYLRPDDPSVTLTIRGRQLMLYGLPYTPLSFGPNAFMRERESMLDSWSKPPNTIDILISHSPPRGILDRTATGRHQGCDGLRAAIDRIKPRLVVCGHVHEARGTETLKWDEDESTLVINAAVMNRAKAVEWNAQTVVI